MSLAFKCQAGAHAYDAAGGPPLARSIFLIFRVAHPSDFACGKGGAFSAAPQLKG
jgi:hypothetical protein